jgi:tetratricopeptide (TPR) repeat protein
MNKGDRSIRSDNHNPGSVNPGVNPKEAARQKLLEAVRTYKDEGKLDLAVENLEKLVAADPQDTMSKFILAECLINKNDLPKAWDALRSISDPDSIGSRYYNLYVNYFFVQKDYKKALEYCEKSVEISQKLKENDELRSFTCFNYALVYRGLKDYRKALKNIDEAIHLFPAKAHFKWFKGEIEKDMKSQRT